MATGRAELQILLKAKDETQRAVRGSRKGFSDLAKAAKAGFAIAAVAAAGAGAAALKMAVDFEKGMAEVATLAPDMSEETFGTLRQGVLDLSKEMGITTSEVVPALYQAISAGVPTENVLTFMELASKAAVGGVTDLETAVDGITSVVNAYGEGVIDAQKAADIMFTGVRLGKTDFAQLSASLFNVIPTAATLGISMEEVTAALATITAQGVPTSVATTTLRSAFVEASKGGTLLDKAIREMTGKSFQELIAGGSNAAGIFDALRTETEASGLSFNDLFGSVEAMNAVLQITGPNAVKMNEALAEMHSSAGAVDTAFATVSSTASFKFSKAVNQVKVIMTEIGAMILPAATVALGGLQNAFTRVSQWIDQNREAIRQTFIKIGLVIQGLWGHFRSGLEVIWPMVRAFFSFLIDNKPVLIAVIVAIGVAIVSALGPVSAAVLAITGMITAIGWLKENWVGVWHAIGEGVESAVNFVIGVLNGLIRATNTAINLWLTPWRKTLEVLGKFIPKAGELADSLKDIIPELGKVHIELGAFSAAADEASGVLKENLNPVLAVDTPAAFEATEKAADAARLAIEEGPKGVRQWADDFNAATEQVGDATKALFERVLFEEDMTFIEGWAASKRDIYRRDALAFREAVDDFEETTRLSRVLFEEDMMFVEGWAASKHDIYRRDALAFREAQNRTAEDAEQTAARIRDATFGHPAVASGAVAPVFSREALIGAAELQGASAATIATIKAGLARAGLGDGGIVTSPTLALIGERGPEAVVPLDRGGGIGPPVVNVTVNVHGTVVSTQFEEEVSRAVRDGIRRGGFDRVFAPA